MNQRQREGERLCRTGDNCWKVKGGRNVTNLNRKWGVTKTLFESKSKSQFRVQVEVDPADWVYKVQLELGLDTVRLGFQLPTHVLDRPTPICSSTMSQKVRKKAESTRRVY